MISQIMNPIVLNNLAVEELEGKDFRSACTLLEKATEIILEDSSIESLSSKKMIQEQMLFFSKRRSFEWSKIIQLPDRSSSGVGNFIFTRAMSIRNLRRRDSKMSPTKQQNNSIHTTDDKAVILYNTALAIQLQAVEEQKPDLALQTRARNLYLLSQAMLRKSGESGFKSKLCFTHFFHIAILNNLGQISYDLVDYRSSAHCFGLLSNNLKYLVQKRKIKKNSKNINSASSFSGNSSITSIALWKVTGYGQSDIAGMFSNTIVQTPTTAPCA